MHGISLQDQAQDEYGNHSPTKDRIQDIGRIVSCTRLDIIEIEIDQKGGKEPQI